MLVGAAAVLGVVAAGCSSWSASEQATPEQATQFLDQFAADWNARDEMAVFETILPDGVYVTPDGEELVGQEVVDQWTRFLSFVEIERKGDAVDNGDASYSFDVEMSGSKRVLTIEMDGDELVSMVETYWVFDFSR
ncbi:MAG: hypothetical protein HKN80_03565 [Acidimicrobiia bacterium]|nr:hypothetical protein [Acidimicrobiia bacterium]